VLNEKSAASPEDQASRRTAVFTMRRSERLVSRCAGYEFEDQIVEELEPGAVLIEPPEVASRDLALRARRWLQRRDLPSGPLAGAGQPLPVEQDLDLLFFMPAAPYDLLALDGYRDWRQRTGYAVCFLQELWISEMDHQLRDLRRILNQFDHVVSGFYHTAEALSERLDTRVDYMPHSVDAELFNPFNGARLKPRSIDACAVGGMDTGAHDALWSWAERTGHHYSFTTTGGAPLSVSPKVHHHYLSQTLQRSKYFFTFLAKRWATGQRNAQEEFGSRYFEGAAAGAVQLGDIVSSNPGFVASLDWDGAVVAADYFSTDLPELITHLESNGQWIETVRRANVANCLTRHDHLHRWAGMLEAAGLTETPGVVARRSRLQEQANALRKAPALAS